jgi:hypothetical protein
MDVSAEPLTDSPAHQFPIEWWSGPVRLEGRLFGESVRGLGFDERSCPRVRGFEIAEALQESADHSPDRDVAAAARRMLSYRAWEVRALALRGDPGAAAAHLEGRVKPLLATAPRSDASQRLEQLAADLATVLEQEEAARLPPR